MTEDRSDPLWWVERLESRFTGPIKEDWQDRKVRPSDSDGTPNRAERLDTLWSYYVGDPPLPKVADEYKETFRDEMRKARSNYAPMPVHALLSRMGLDGVLTGVDQDANGDDLAQKIMDESNLAATFKDLLAYTFALGDSYAMVVPGPTPTVHAIDPRKCVAFTDPQDPNRLTAAMVKSYDPIEQVEVARLFLPGVVYTLHLNDGWKVVDDEPSQVPEELGGIPIVQFKNANGLGEYEAHLDVLDRINDVNVKILGIAAYQLFKQRAVIGNMPGDDDDDTTSTPPTPDEMNDIFRSDPGALWFVPEGFTFWESTQADITPLIASNRDNVKEFSAQTTTPLYLFTPDAASGSAEGASLMREGLNHKVVDRRARLTPAIKLVFRIAFAMAGEPGRGETIRLLWGSIESNSLADKGSATAQSSGVLSKQNQLREIWGMDPIEVSENLQQLVAENLMGLPAPGGSQPAMQPAEQSGPAPVTQQDSTSDDDPNV